jgi:tetratricopeptide (TPR) repeat protein
MKTILSSILLSTVLCGFSVSAIGETSRKGSPQSIQLNEQGVRKVKANDFIAAEELFRKAVVSDRYNLTAVFNLASMFMQNKKISAAIDLLSGYAKEGVPDAGIYARLGDAYFANKSIDEAQQQYKRALDLDSRYPGLAARLGTLYSLKNDLPSAEAILKKGIDLEPKNGQLLANYSSILLANGKTHDAIAAAKRALQVQPSTEVYITLGNAYKTMKDYKNALISFQRARDLGDTRRELIEQIDTLEDKLG